MINLQTGPEVCKSRASGMLGSKENSPVADEKDIDENSEESDKRPATRGPNLENNKRLIQHVDEHLKKSKPKSLDEALNQIAVAKKLYG
jgi:hypothetical protein